MMRKILVIGAGRSSTSLINYILHNADKESWKLFLADREKELAIRKINNHTGGEYLDFDPLSESERASVIPDMDLVISMLPARFHPVVIADCIKFGVNVITPSYISKEVREMNEKAEENGVLVLNEVGLDPGIDHMSAMQIIDEIRREGGQMSRFESFTGGLVAPESDTNPWNYKFTWNPRNVVLAGQGGTAMCLQQGEYKYIPYHKLFSRTQVMEIGEYGEFEGYANRDSLSYIDVYDLQGIPTIYRGTLRRRGFSKAWDTFVQLGMTDDSYIMKGTEDMSYRDFVNSFLSYRTDVPVEEKLQQYLNLSDEIMYKLKWLGIFSDEKVGLKEATPAQVLQKVLEDKWSLEENDKDMIVMWHKFGYTLKGKEFERTSSMVVIGEDQDETGMSKTVGLPIGIAAKLILNGNISRKGVILPKFKELYEPILKELEEYGIVFEESTQEI